MNEQNLYFSKLSIGLVNELRQVFHQYFFFPSIVRLFNELNRLYLATSIKLIGLMN